MTATFISNDNARDISSVNDSVVNEQEDNNENIMLKSLAVASGAGIVGNPNGSVPMSTYGSSFNPLPPNDYAPNRPGGGNVPIGPNAADLSNYKGTKFTRGWLAGDGGAHIDQALGSCAFSVRPAPYNNKLGADFRAVVPEYGAPVAGLANWDVNAPGRQASTSNTVLASGEFIPATWDSRLNGLDITSGNIGPRVFTADQGIIKAPVQQYNAFAQVPEGGNVLPINAGYDGITFGTRANPNVWQATGPTTGGMGPSAMNITRGPQKRSMNGGALGAIQKGIPINNVQMGYPMKKI
jgi:hypothetical protein